MINLIALHSFLRHNIKTDIHNVEFLKPVSIRCFILLKTYITYIVDVRETGVSWSENCIFHMIRLRLINWCSRCVQNVRTDKTGQNGYHLKRNTQGTDKKRTRTDREFYCPLALSSNV